MSDTCNNHACESFQAITDTDLQGLSSSLKLGAVYRRKVILVMGWLVGFMASAQAEAVKLAEQPLKTQANTNSAAFYATVKGLIFQGGYGFEGGFYFHERFSCDLSYQQEHQVIHILSLGVKWYPSKTWFHRLETVEGLQPYGGIHFLDASLSHSFFNQKSDQGILFSLGTLYHVTPRLAADVAWGMVIGANYLSQRKPHLSIGLRLSLG